MKPRLRAEWGSCCLSPVKGNSVLEVLRVKLGYTDKAVVRLLCVDAKTSRSRAGQPLYLFVSRVLLGNAFVCSTPTSYKRPPCSHHGCPSVNAATPCEAHAGVTFDSVLGTHRDGHTRLIFREFVVYEKSLSYPEFLVEYVRQ